METHRDNGLRVDESPADGKSVLNSVGRDGLLDEELRKESDRSALQAKRRGGKGHASTQVTHSRSIVGESLEDGQLDILSGRGRSTESWGRSNDEGVGPLLGVELLDILVEGRVDLGVLVGRDDEGCALASENGLGGSAVGLDYSDNLEAGAELVLETEGVVPGSCCGEKESQRTSMAAGRAEAGEARGREGVTYPGRIPVDRW